MPSNLPEGIVQFNVRLPKELHQRLRREAYDTNRSINDLALEALAVYLDALARQRARGISS